MIMINLLTKSGLLVTVAAIGVGSLAIESVQAASFTFSFGATGNGQLSFQNSLLTGIGTETINFFGLQQTDASALFNFNYTAVPPVAFPNPRQIEFSADASSNPLFTFEAGQLVGINYTTPNKPYRFSDSRRCGPTGGCFQGEGDVLIDLQGTTFRRQDDIISREFTSAGQLVSTFNSTVTFDSGRINFLTIAPVAAIPEPTTLLGIGAAVGLGGLFRKMKQTQ
jgi:hypothetical protein